MSDNLEISLLPAQKQDLPDISVPPLEVPEKPVCLYPWFHQRVNTDGTATPCCNFTTHNTNIAAPYKDFFYSDQMQAIREEMLLGRVPTGCRECVEREQIGSYSSRDIAKYMASRIGLVYLNKPSLLYQEIDYSNLCNVRCKMCNSVRSYKIVGDEKELNIAPSPRLESNWTLGEKDLHTIKMLRFLGGEPLLHIDRIEYELKRLKDVGRLQEIYICINTNMMVSLSDSFLELALQCKDVNINGSIDAYGDLNSYIRTDSDWNTILNNFLLLDELSKKHGNFTYQPVHTISILNCNKLNELYKFWDSTLINMGNPTSAIYVTFPFCYDIGNLPLNIKKILLNRYDEWEIELPKWKAHINSIKSILSSTLDIHPRNNVINELFKRNNVFDRRCKFTFEDVNKEMYDWLNQYKGP